MSEQDAISAVRVPATTETITRDLLELGLVRGSTVLVHSSLKSLGWVCGGAVAVLNALIAAISDQGNLVVPTQTTHYSDPSLWNNPPVPQEWHSTIRRAMPAYDPRTTPSRGMGCIAEAFRTFPNVVRSNHPHVSFAARGPDSESLLAEQPLNDGLGTRSPLARLYAIDAFVLLLGVGHDCNTSLHLAERIAYADTTETQTNGAPLLVDGQREWVRFEEPAPAEIDFAIIGNDFRNSTNRVCVHPVAGATAELMRQRHLVDYGVQWMEVHR